MKPGSWLQRGLNTLRDRGPNGVQFWFIALVLGAASGLAAVWFRMIIETLQSLIYGAAGADVLHSHLEQVHWLWLIFVPTLGGLLVGLVLHYGNKQQVSSVADVIEAAALHDGRLQKRSGWVSSLASLITLSTGGSTGREGPVVHLAGLLATQVSTAMRADGITGRDLLGCAVAAAVSASFNAPIAGALFALEVVLRHFAVHAFAPIVIASVAGTVVSRIIYGDVTEFTLPIEAGLQFYVELPAFMILGLLCGVIAVIFMKSVFWTDDFASRTHAQLGWPPYARPTVAGLLLGIMATQFPHIIGVGYETTSRALTGALLWHEAVIFLVVKIAAVAITVGGRMGGGVFSPALMIGALLGLAFGLTATAVLPDVSGDKTLYALAGMGAVAAAVLGAPISTGLIVFEMTGDWQTGLAVLVSVSLSSAIASNLVDRSFFLTQLERRGVHLAAGPQAYLLATFRVESVMRSAEHPRAAPQDQCWDMIGDGTYLDANSTLEQAMPLFERTNAAFLPVVSLRGGDQPPELWGALFQIDALKAYNRALAATAAEEHS